MITIFTTPKAFTGHNKITQENAIQSWKRIVPRCEVILLGNDDGVAEAAQKYECKHIADVSCNEYGTPLISGLFNEAERHASNRIMCYVNGDIMFTSSLLQAVELIKHKKKFLMVGQRYNVDIDSSLNFMDHEWESSLFLYSTTKGILNQPFGIDYFIFPKGQFVDIPDLVVGRAWWDNWMIYNARKKFIPIIDATRVILAVHQNHDYSHCIGGLQEAYYKGPEVMKNLSYVKDGKVRMSIEDAEWVLDNGKIKLTYDRYKIHILHLPFYFPVFKWPVAVVSFFWRLIKSFIK